MIHDLKPYPAMKDSGVPWLGKVPEKWEVLPALATYKPKFVKNTGMVEKTVLSLSYGRIIVKPVEKLRGLVPESFETYQIVDLGNIIVRTTDLQNDHTSLRIGHSRNRGIITSAYLCLETTDRISNEFGYQFLNTYDLLKIIYGFGSGLRQNLGFSDIKRMPVLVPPKDQQSAIVRFLNYAESRIRRYISTKQKLIKLLEEQKQAIIHRAVTRGLDPNVRLKPSGVGWFGEMPEHWSQCPIKRLLSRMDYGTSEAARVDGKVRVLTMGNIQQGEVTVPKSGGLDEVPAELLLSNHDLLFTRTNGNPDLVGKVGLFRGDVKDQITFASYLVRLRVKPPFHARWLHFVLNSWSFWAFARSHALVNLQTNLNSTRYGQFSVSVPPPEEQRQIVDWIESETRQCVAAAASAKHEIALLREYRIRLIADVVTGKLDVREAAAKLSEETDEPEPLDDAEALVEGDEETENADLDAVTEEAEA